MKIKENSTLWGILLYVLCLFPILGCSDNNDVVSAIPDQWVTDVPQAIEFDVKGGTKKVALKFADGVSAAHVACIMSESNRPWCDASIDADNNLSVTVKPYGYARTAPITLIYDKDHIQLININQKSDYSAYFADDACSVLKQGITDAEIESIPQEEMRNLAKALKAGDYETEFRVAEYRPYQHPSVMAAVNKTGKYSLRDNPTGIYVDKGDIMYIYINNVYEGANISINIQDVGEGYNNNKTIALKEGLNRVEAPISGLIYLFNHVEDNIPLLLETEDEKRAAAAKTITAHFLFGKVNGYFDIAKHKTNEKWHEILSKAQWRDIDALGLYSHVTWNVEQFKGNNVQSNAGVETDIVRSLENTDRLVYLEQEFLGLKKYNKMFNNRMHLCVDYQAASPNATDYRTVYNYSRSYAEPFCNPDKFASRLWGPAHEVGHVNQTRPGLKWSGMTEVTNNLTALYVQTSFGLQSKLQTDKGNPKDENGQGLPNYSSLKNLYEISNAYIVDKKRAHCLPSIDINLHETQLVPFWQLKLYICDALGQSDFYKDLYEYFRTHKSPSDEGKNQGLNQLDFVRQACRISGVNLLDFFEKWGFLTPVNTQLNDYGTKSFIITQNQVDELRKEIEDAGYEKAADNLWLITDNTWENYKK